MSFDSFIIRSMPNGINLMIAIPVVRLDKKRLRLLIKKYVLALQQHLRLDRSLKNYSSLSSIVLLLAYVDGYSDVAVNHQEPFCENTHVCMPE